jgi:hypothetical protein
MNACVICEHGNTQPRLVTVLHTLVEQPATDLI